MERSHRSVCPNKILAKLIIRCISEAVDQRLRQKQAGFQKGRGCTDQISTLHNIIEQCTEWQGQLYIWLHGFWEGFRQHPPESLILAHTQSIWNSTTDHPCYQELLLQLQLDWAMQQATSDSPWGIRWTLLSTLEDLDFANDSAPVSHTCHHMQEKTTGLSMFAQQVGLTISQKKTEVMIQL